MDLALRDLGALARARRAGTTLASEQARTAAAGEIADAEVPPQTGDVSKTLEALRAVLPATLIALYSALVIPLQGFAISNGADARAAQQAEIAKSLGNDAAKVKAALAALTVEPDALLSLRIAVAVIVAVFVFIYAYRKAQTVENQRVILEPLVTLGAFVAWELASPGTFLAALLTAQNLPVYTTVIAGLTAIGLWAVSETTLKKKAT
jgi:lysylphosphatidylglycerol synthetase-like protein (DUF2156 family)